MNPFTVFLHVWLPPELATPILHGVDTVGDPATRECFLTTLIEKADCAAEPAHSVVEPTLSPEKRSRDGAAAPVHSSLEPTQPPSAIELLEDPPGL